MENKKALIMHNTLEIIVAILGLLIIGGIFLAIYLTINTDNELDNVSKTLDKIISSIKKLEVEKSTSLTLQGFKNSENWLVRGFSKTTPNRPESCFNLDRAEPSSCICLCKSEDTCQNFCEIIFENEIEIHGDRIEITNPVPTPIGGLNSRQGTGQYYNENFISLSKILKEIQIIKKPNKIILQSK
jgi:hypothetical protein